MKKSKIIIFTILTLCIFVLFIQHNSINILQKKNEAKNTSINKGSNINEKNKYSVSINEKSKDNLSALAVYPKRFFRNSKSIDYSHMQFTPWNVAKASANVIPRKKKPYTFMIYMNGSDLESENGAATEDLLEMLESGVNSENVNIVLFTGGTNRWQNNVIPENECVLWEIEDGELFKIASVGLINMGDPGTLSSFINFSITNFPAEKFGLILWDHGGGSIAGYGHDEKFNESRLSLLDLNYAFEESVLSKEKIEFLGFDSCLMASVEMAVIASDYFKYMIASEELEPGAGWDYNFLSVLNSNLKMDGASLGIAIINYFMNFYGIDSNEDLTMSVIDLSKATLVMETMGDLMNLCSSALLTDREASFKTFAKKRGATKTFGVGSPRDNESDMVDIGHMAQNLNDIFPDETSRVYDALNEAVVYTMHNSNINLSGLSTYYVYGGRETAKESINIYKSLDMDEYYTDYLINFFNFLNVGRYNKSRQLNSGNQTNNTLTYQEENIDVLRTDLTIWQPIFGDSGNYQMIGLKENTEITNDVLPEIIKNSLWPKINGQNICMYPISESDNRILYAVPALVNGKDCDIIILVNSLNPKGKVLGTRQEDGFIIQKGYDPLKPKDKISFYLQTNKFNYNSSDSDNNSGDINWHKTDEFIVDNNLQIEWSPIISSKVNIFYNLRLTNYKNEKHYTELKKITSM